jgi:endonuclease YncB( thermonuclease family)
MKGGGGRWRRLRDIAVLILLVSAVVRLIWSLEGLKGEARARDGDSLLIGKQEVRLFGIDAPELHQKCLRADGRTWPCGRKARDRLGELLRGGKVRCRPLEKDRYGRDVAVCLVGETDVAAVLVREGLATAFGPASPYRREEALARKEGRGIWQGPFLPPAEWRRRQGGDDRS